MEMPDYHAVRRSLNKSLLQIILFSAVINLLMLAAPLYSLQVFDRVLSSRSQDTLLFLSLITLFLLLMQGGLDWVRARLMHKQALALDANIAPGLLQSTLLAQAEGKSVEGSPGQPINDLSDIRGSFLSPGLSALFDLPFTPFFLIFMFLLHPLLGWISLAAAVVLVIFALVTAIAARQPQDSASLQRLAASQKINDALQNAQAVSALGIAGNLASKWRLENAEILWLQERIASRLAAMNAMTKTFRQMLQIAIMGAGAWLVLENLMGAGGMIAGSIIMGRALAPLEQAASNYKSWRSSWQAWKRLSALLPQQPNQSPTELPAPQGELKLENVHLYSTAFSAQQAITANRAVLSQVSFRLGAGKILAISGPSGSGKSTLAKIIAGVIQPDSGDVRLDGAELKQWDKNRLGQFLGWLPQDVQLLSGTIKENIARFGDADDQAVIEAAKKAGVHQLILQMPAGYDTPISNAAGGQSVVLSGGQKQRIGLARALYKNPRLLILDEPDASLDEFGIDQLHKTIQQCHQEGCTVVFISYRPSTLALAQWVLLLDQGKVRHAGPASEVFAAATTSVAKNSSRSAKPQQKIKPAVKPTGPQLSYHFSQQSAQPEKAPSKTSSVKEKKLKEQGYAK